jgi:flagellar hook-associated protein 2
MIAGLSSGFDWRSMIDQLMAIEHRRVDLVINQKSEYASKLQILRAINTKLLSFKSQAETLASSKTFSIFTSSLSTDSATYSASDFLSVYTSTGAAPGSHTITMTSTSTLAQARKIATKSFNSHTDALGLTGEFVINGRAIEVEDTDDLGDLRDKINNLNSGANATGVTASILTASSSNFRLVLTSDNTGADAFTIFDSSADTTNILSTGLGFTDGTTSVKNYTSNGFQSAAFSSSTQAVGSMLGLNSAQSGIVTIGGVGSIDINLSTDSLTDIAAEINNESGGSVAASVVATTEDGVTAYRLKIENTTSYLDDNNILQTIGLIEGGQGDVAEVHKGSKELYADAGKSSYITGATAWNSVYDSDGISTGVVDGDVILIKGTRHDGSTVDTSFTITDKAWTIDEAGNSFLEAIESAFGLAADSVTLSNGQIQITDSTAGDSQLSISLICQNQGGGSLDLGTVSATTQGYTMELQAGQDASLIVDGTAITSSSNVIDDVIAGVTLNLKTVEAGSTINLTVARDYDSIKSSVQGLLDAYNDVLSDINEQFAYDEETETAGLLQGDATLRSIKTGLVDILVSAVSQLPSGLNALSLIGITSDDNGMLSIDNDDFMDALRTDFNGVRRLFVAEGSTTDGDVQYINHTNDTVAGEYEINITQVATQAQAIGSVDLSGGIGATNIATLTISQGGKVAAINLNGASGENGSSIDNIVNAINSELDGEYAQSIVGNVRNTLSDGITAITSATTWGLIYSGGADAGLSDGQEITFSGHRKNGTEVNGAYTISDANQDTVQGLLSAIESAFEYEVSAGINAYGYLVITDKTTGSSSLDISITEPGSLNFGAVTTSNLIGATRNTKNAGADAIAEGDTWSDVDGHTLAGGEVIKFIGFKGNGEAVEGSYTVNLGDQLSVFLSAIEAAYGGVVDASIQDGRLMLSDGTANSMLGIEILEPTGGGVDFGTMSGGVTGRYGLDITASRDGFNQLVLTSEDYGSSATFSVSQSDTSLGLGPVTAGVDVEGTINNESATGSGQILTGDAPGSGETSSVEGLIIKYTGTDTGDQGTVKITMGVAELFDRLLYDITNAADGYLDYRLESTADRIDTLETQIQEMEARLEMKMQTMINRFVAMEVALGKIQNLSRWLDGQISTISRGWV